MQLCFCTQGFSLNIIDYNTRFADNNNNNNTPHHTQTATTIQAPQTE